MNIDNYFSKFQAYAAIPIRLVIGLHLIIGSQDNVFSWDRMLEFEAFLTEQGLPFPLLGAITSVYAQFISGILFLIGWKVRWAASVMIVNFIIAILLVHIGDSWSGTFPAIVMLAGAIFLLLNGSGKWSIDNPTS